MGKSENFITQVIKVKSEEKKILFYFYFRHQQLVNTTLGPKNYEKYKSGYMIVITSVFDLVGHENGSQDEILR